MVDTEEYVMVRVGEKWTRRKPINDPYPDRELTGDFRVEADAKY